MALLIPMNNKEIIVINGTGGSGKDTFVEFCMKYAKVKNFSSIDKVKEIARLIGWDGQKREKDRKFLSDLKKLTTEYNNMPFNSIKDAIDEFNNSDDEILFIHVREPEEIKKVVDAFGANTLLVKRVGLANIESNYSDANVDNYPYDYVIENNTLEQLDSAALNFVNEVKKNEVKLKIKKIK